MSENDTQDYIKNGLLQTNSFLSKDYAFVQRMLEAGIITEDEIESLNLSMAKIVSKFPESIICIGFVNQDTKQMFTDTLISNQSSYPHILVSAVLESFDKKYPPEQNHEQEQLPH